MNIIQNVIYDSVCINNKQLSLKEEHLDILTNCCFEKGDKVEIEKIIYDYRYIGVMDDEDSYSLPYPNLRQNKGIITLGKTRLKGKKEYRTNYIQTSYYKNTWLGLNTPTEVSLYKEFIGSSIKNKLTFSKNYIRFFIDDLKILAYGKIDKTRFIAKKCYNLHNNYGINPVEITGVDTFYRDMNRPQVGLNFAPINISGNINLSEYIYLVFEPKIYVNNIIYNSKYNGQKSVRIDMEYAFEVKTKIYSLKKDKINVYSCGNKNKYMT